MKKNSARVVHPAEQIARESNVRYVERCDRHGTFEIKKKKKRKDGRGREHEQII